MCWAVSPTLAVLLGFIGDYQNLASKVYFVDIILEDLCLNWLSWFPFLILVGSQFVIAIICHHY